jgi:hypothetical protein
MKEGAKHEDLKIQVYLQHGKGKEKHQGATPPVDDQI